MPARTSSRARPALLGAAVLMALVTGCSATADPPAAPLPSSPPSPSPTTSGEPTPSPTATSAAPTPEVREIAVTVAGGRVRPAGLRVEVKPGTKVRLTVTSDVADELHSHANDRSVPVTPGKPAVMEFTVTETGSFEVEMHDSGDVVLTLLVR